MARFMEKFSFGTEEIKPSKMLADYLSLLSLMETDESLLTPEFLEVVSNWSYLEESHSNPEIGSRVSLAFYGEEYEGKQIVERAAKLKGVSVEDIMDISKGSGFERVFHITPGLTDEQYLLIEMLIAWELTITSLAEMGADQPDLFLTATSMPLLPYFEKFLAAAVGIDNFESVPKPYLKACDSSGSAFYDVLTGRYDQLLRKLYADKFERGEPAVITIFAFEDGFRNSELGGDENSAQVFTTGAAAMSFLYHPDRPDLSTFRHVVGEQRAVEAGADCLRFKDTTVGWPEEATDPERMAPYLTEPDEGIVDMRRETPVYFRDNGTAIAGEVWNKFKTYLENELQRELSNEEVSEKIKKVIVHHPSMTIFNHVVKRLVGDRRHKGFGFKEEQIQWVITEGNAPSATIPMAFGRQIEDLEKGDYVMFLSYGAGGSFTCQIVQL